MKSVSKIICCSILFPAMFAANAQGKITTKGIKDLSLTNQKDTQNISNNKLLYTVVNPIRCMINVNGPSNTGSVLDFKSTRYNTGGTIIIDLNTETITFKTAGLYHIEGSFFSFFVDDSPHELLLSAKINGESLEPLDYKTTPSNNAGFSSTSLKFQNDIYFTGGTTLQFTINAPGMKNIRGFFSANYISP